HAMAYHWRTARDRGESLPLAIIIGPDLPTMATGSASFPYGIDELAVAGGFMGAPIELVRCKTIPLEVPANAEAIIECEMSTEMGEPRLTFGEYPGYMQSNIIPTPVVKVTAITYRNNAIFTPILVGMPPSDTSLVWGFAHAADHFHYLKYECGYPVAEVYYPQLSGGDTFCLIRMAEGATPDDGQTVADELSRRRSIGKYAVVVDHDIDIRDSDTILWALSFRTNRRRDFAFVPSGHVGLDPSGAPPGARTNRSNDPADNDATRVVINATRKWDYPPVGLPRKEYMDRALQLWAEAKLPQPQMHNPWYGYELGYWTDEHRHHADLIVAGDYKQLGDEMEEFQAPLTEAQIGRNFDRSAAWL
ncbi:MAG TPA: UbiD family decarboxylase, partial [Chloroflexota bacterium]